MPVTLENRLRRLQVFNLPHETNCRHHCACAELALVVVEQNPRTGELAPRRVIRRVPDSLTLLALERRAGLPAAVLDAPEVRNAITLGHIVVREHSPDSGAVAVAAAASPAAGPPQAAGKGA